MSKKLFSLFALITLLASLLPATVVAAPPHQGGQEGDTTIGNGKASYTVQKDDSLSKLADKEYGDPFAYPAVYYHINLMAAKDDSFDFIADEVVVEELGPCEPRSPPIVSGIEVTQAIPTGQPFVLGVSTAAIVHLSTGSVPVSGTLTICKDDIFYSEVPAKVQDGQLVFEPFIIAPPQSDNIDFLVEVAPTANPKEIDSYVLHDQKFTSETVAPKLLYVPMNLEPSGLKLTDHRPDGDAFARAVLPISEEEWFYEKANEITISVGDGDCSKGICINDDKHLQPLEGCLVHHRLAQILNTYKDPAGVGVNETVFIHGWIADTEELEVVKYNGLSTGPDRRISFGTAKPSNGQLIYVHELLHGLGYDHHNEFLFSIRREFKDELDQGGRVWKDGALCKEFENKLGARSCDASIIVKKAGKKWTIITDAGEEYLIERDSQEPELTVKAITKDSTIDAIGWDVDRQLADYAWAGKHDKQRKLESFDIMSYRDTDDSWISRDEYNSAIVKFRSMPRSPLDLPPCKHQVRNLDVYIGEPCLSENNVVFSGCLNADKQVVTSFPRETIAGLSQPNYTNSNLVADDLSFRLVFKREDGSEDGFAISRIPFDARVYSHSDGVTAPTTDLGYFRVVVPPDVVAQAYDFSILELEQQEPRLSSRRLLRR